MEQLTAVGKITIDKPLADVWKFITKPNQKQTWWFEDGRYLISSWNAGDPIYINYEDDTEDWRGSITQREENLSLLYNLHSAEEEDEGYDDYVEEIWRLTVNSIDNEHTELVLTKSDMDAVHDSDDAHDHKQTMINWKETHDHYLPKVLQGYKEAIEAS